MSQYFIFEEHFRRPIILHFQLMHVVKHANEVLNLWEKSPLILSPLSNLATSEKRDSLREILILANRKGYFDDFASLCASIYPQIDNAKIQLEDVFTVPKNKVHQSRLNQTLKGEHPLKAELIILLAQLSAEDLNQIAFMLGVQWENISYTRFFASEVKLNQPTEANIQDRLDRRMAKFPHTNRKEIESKLRKFGASPTEEDMRKTLTHARIQHNGMQLEELQFELKKLLAEDLVSIFDRRKQVEAIINAYLHL